MNYIDNCPLCNTSEFTNVLELQDYFLSKEHFTIVKCSHCGLAFTQPQPLPENLPSYYQSEEYISHSNIRKGLSAKLYQTIRNYTLSGKYKIIESIVKPGLLLDIGCGTGEFLAEGRKRGWKVTGTEPNASARQQAMKNFQITVYEPEKLQTLPGNYFDVITLWHVLEHVSSLEDTIVNLKRLLKEDGLLVIAVPDHSSKDAAIYGKYWAAYDVPRHLYHFTPATLKKILAKYSVSVIKQKPLVFDSFYISLLSEEYKSGKKRFLRAFFNGLRSNCWAMMHHHNYSSFMFLCRLEKLH